MAKLDDLVQELEAEAPLDARGEFSIDADKAREKMQRFQLAVPEHYVLLVIQAAILRGATAIRVDTDSDDVIFRFDGDPFTAEELGELYASIFTDGGDRRVRSRQHLAIALNAATAMVPSFIRVTTPHAALEIRPGRPDRLKAIEGGRPGLSTLHVRDRLRPGVLAQFVRSLSGTIVEAQVIRERCTYAEVPIVVNNEPIQCESASAGLHSAFEIPLLGGRGVVGVTPEVHRTAPKAIARLIAAGVAITTHPFDAPDGVVAIARSDAFNTDVSHTDVVLDAIYDDAASRLSIARDRVVASMVDVALTAEPPRWLVPALRAWMMSSRTTRKIEEVVVERPPLAALLRLPLWRSLGKAPKTTDDLLSKETWPFVHGHEVKKEAIGMAQLAEVLILSGDEEDFVRDRLGRKIEHAGARVERVLAREAAIARWKSRVHPGGLGPARTIDREPFTAGEVSGEVGLLVEGLLRSRLLVVVEGAVLEEIDLPGPMPGIIAYVSGPLAPTYVCDGALRNDAFGVVLLELLAAIERLVRRVAATPPAISHATLQESLKHFVRAVIVADYAVQFLVSVGFGHKAALDLVRDHPLIQVTPRWGVGADEHEPPHALATLELFPSIDQPARSLSWIAEARRRKVPIYWVSSAIERVDAAEVLVLDPMRKAWLDALLGQDALRDYRPVVASKERLRNHLRKPTEGLVIVEAAFVARHAKDGIEVTWGVHRRRPAERPKALVASVRVLAHHRHVATMDLEAPIHGLVAVANDDELHARPGYDGLVWAANRRLRTVLDEGLVRLVAAAVAEVGATREAARKEALRYLLLAASAAVYGGPELAALHRRMIEESGADLAAIELSALLQASAGYSPVMFTKTVDFVHEQPGHVTASLVVDRLGPPSRKPIDAVTREIALRTALAELLPVIVEVPIIDAVGGGEATLTAIYAELARVGVVRYVGPATNTRGYDGAEGLVLSVASEQLVGLRGLFAGEQLIESASWLHERQALRAFEERPQLGELKLAVQDRLVAIELDAGKFRGEVGLRKVLPGDPRASIARVSMDRRPIAAIELDDLSLPLVAVLDAAELDVDTTYTAISKRSYKALRSTLRGAIEPLLVALVDHFHAVPVADRRLAVAWLIDLLQSRCEGGAPSRKRLLADPLLGRIARLPLFVTGGGSQRSLSDLFVAVEGKNPLRYSSVALDGAPEAIVVDEGAQRLLFRFFAHRVDMAEVLAAEALGARRRAAAPPLPEGPPAGAFAVRSVDKPALAGALWIAATGDPVEPLAATIAVGDRGRVIEESRLCEPLFVGGVVRGGSDVKVDPEWKSATIAGNQRRRIRRWAVDLWREIAGEYRRGLGLLAAPGPEEGLLERLGLLRDALWFQLCALRAADQRLADSIAALRDELVELPLLPLANHRLISLRQALREQPPELIELGLWVPAPEPDSALVDALHAELLAAVRGRGPGPGADPGAGPKGQVPKDMSVGAGTPPIEPRVFTYVAPIEDPASAPHLVRPHTIAVIEDEVDEVDEVDVAEGDVPPEPTGALAPSPADSLEIDLEPGPGPEQILLERVLDELRLVRNASDTHLTEGHLVSITVSSGAGRRVVERRRNLHFLDLRHPLVRAACIRGGDEPTLISFVASALYTALNVDLEEIEDAHEEAFHYSHARLITQSLGAP